MVKLYKHLEVYKGKYTIKLEKFKEVRSLDQNAYYFVILDILRQYFGYTDVLSLHEDMKTLHGLKENRHNKIENKNVVENTSTANYSTKEFNTYIENIRNWAKIEYNLDTPEPE